MQVGGDLPASPYVVRNLRGMHSRNNSQGSNPLLPLDTPAPVAHTRPSRTSSISGSNNDLRELHASHHRRFPSTEDPFHALHQQMLQQRAVRQSRIGALGLEGEVDQLVGTSFDSRSTGGIDSLARRMLADASRQYTNRSLAEAREVSGALRGAAERAANVLPMYLFTNMNQLCTSLSVHDGFTAALCQ